jgi:nickel-dependent lactate racemase
LFFFSTAAQKWVKLKRTIKKDRNAFVVAFSKTKEEKNKIRIAQVIKKLYSLYFHGELHYQHCHIDVLLI